MLPGFPPGIFPFWGPFPAVPPAAAAAAASGAPDAPRSSTEATWAAGKDKIWFHSTKILLFTKMQTK